MIQRITLFILLLIAPCPQKLRAELEAHGTLECLGTRTTKLDFYDNKIHHVADDFVEIDGYARNYRVFRNRMRESLSGISLAQALDGPVWIVRNLILDCSVCKGTEIVRNNIWVGQRHGFMSWMQTVSPLDWDYDNLYAHRFAVADEGRWIAMARRYSRWQTSSQSRVYQALVCRIWAWADRGATSAARVSVVDQTGLFSQATPLALA